MARTKEQIKAQILADINASGNTDLIQAFTGNLVNKYTEALLEALATSQSTSEQAVEVLINNSTDLLANNVFLVPNFIKLVSIGSSYQTKYKAPFYYQYGDVIRIQIKTDGTPIIGYESENINAQIVSRISIKVNTNTLQTTINLAKLDPVTKLTNAEVTDYTNFIKYVGGLNIGNVAVQSLDPDLLNGVISIEYNGNYTATIATDVNNAIDNYLKQLAGIDSFGSDIYLSGLIAEIEGVTGVVSVNIATLYFTIAGTTTNTYLINLVANKPTILANKYSPAAGYAIRGGSLTINLVAN